MTQPETSTETLIADELDLLATLVPLAGTRLVEAGCGDAQLARRLLEGFTNVELTALEVDERQLAKNLASPPQARLRFVNAGAERIPLPDAACDGALMLKSLHHVPVPLMAQALADVARVLRPGGWLYVSEPVYGGEFNELVRLFNDEREVRAAAQRALDEAVRGGRFDDAADLRFRMPVRFADFADFERRLMRPTFAERHVDDALRAAVRARFEPYVGRDGRPGAYFERPMHARLLRRRG